MQESEHQVHFFRQLNETPEVGKVVEIPAGVDDKGFMLDFYARAFQFPDWFGHNWDALLDCLRDVDGSHGQICIRHADIPFASNRTDREAYLDVLLLTCTMHKGNVVASFPQECMAEIDGIILAYWKSEYPDIKTCEDVLAIVSRIVFPQLRVCMSPGEVYKVVEILLKESTCPSALYKKLDDALNAGSSGLEILGSIRLALVDPSFSGFIDSVLSEKRMLSRKDVISYVDKVFGR